MTSFPYPLPSLPTHIGATSNVITNWMRGVKDASDQQVALVLEFLNEDYLCSVPLHIGSFFVKVLAEVVTGSKFSPHG